MLKSLSDNSYNTNCNNNGYSEINDDAINNNHLLGFSLSSPYIKIQGKNRDPPHLFDHSSLPSPTTSSCLFSPHFINNSKSASFGVVGDKDVFLHSPLSVKSDGSLLTIERSQTVAMGLDSSPKLEDFLGSAGQQYRAENREEILSLDFLQHPTKEKTGEIQLHQNPYFYGLHCQNMNQAPIDTQVQNNQNWIVGCYTDHLPLNQQINCTTMTENGSGSASTGDLQSLSLSMSPGSQSSCITTPLQISSNDTDTVFLAIETMKKNSVEVASNSKQTMHRKSIEAFGQRTSQYRGVTRHRWTGRYEAHLWDNSCRKEGQARKGRQVYLGGYDKEDKAARAYDSAALKYWGSSTHINFPLENYQLELEKMKDMSRQEYVAHLRRRSSGFSRGASIYRGVTRHHQHGRWQARIGRVAGNKDLYLGTFSTQEEAAEAYDIAAIKFRGVNAVTNFDISCYNAERILASNTLPAREPNIESIQKTDESVQINNTVTSNFSDLEMALYQPPVPQHHNMGDSPAFLASNSMCSRQVTVGEASPDRNDASVYFAKTSPITNKFISSATNLNSWIPSAPISRAHVPVFSTWGNM